VLALQAHDALLAAGRPICADEIAADTRREYDAMVRRSQREASGGSGLVVLRRWSC
jgi:hypothetical protein